MSTYTINGGYDDECTVEAASYGIHDGYFHFSDAAKARVFSIQIQRVITVQRSEDS